LRHVILIHTAVAVVVDSVACRIRGRRCARGAAVDHRAVDALGRASTGASPNATARRGRNVVFIDLTVAIVVLTIANAVICRGRSGGAAVLYVPPNTGRSARCGALPNAAVRRCGDVIFVDLTVAVVVDAIASAIVGGGRPWNAAALNAATHTGSHPGGSTLPHAAG
jgi:hypothetical protein